MFFLICETIRQSQNVLLRQASTQQNRESPFKSSTNCAQKLQSFCTRPILEERPFKTIRGKHRTTASLDCRVLLHRDFQRKSKPRPRFTSLLRQHFINHANPQTCAHGKGRKLYVNTLQKKVIVFLYLYYIWIKQTMYFLCEYRSKQLLKFQENKIVIFNLVTDQKTQISKTS